MKILYVLQPSVTNRDGKYVAADSNVEMMKHVIKEILLYRKWEFDVLVPKRESLNFSFEEIINSKRVNFVEWDYPENPVKGRFHFNSKQLPRKDYDVLWNNISELTKNFRVFYDLPIINCNYFLDTPDYSIAKSSAYTYFLRQVEGALAADLVPFTCFSTRKRFLNQVSKYLNLKFAEKIRNKSTIWDFGVSTAELNGKKSKKNREKIITFPNRITQNPDYTNFLPFLRAIKKLRKMREDFKVQVFNPSYKYYSNIDLSKIMPNYFRMPSFPNSPNREEYIKGLWNSWIGVTLFLREAYGGICHRELIVCDNLVITPKVNEYLYHQGEHYPFYCKSDFSDLHEVMNHALYLTQKEINKIMQNVKSSVINNSSYERVIPRVIEDIEKLEGR